MAFTTNASYVPTIQLFLAHWAQVNAALPSPLVLADEEGVAAGRARLEQLLADLRAGQAEVIDKLNDRELARGDIEIKKRRLLALLNEFNARLDAFWARSVFVKLRPGAPGIGEGLERFLRPVEDAARLWLKLEAEPAPPGVVLPLALSDGTDLAAFTGLIADLRAAFQAERLALLEAQIARHARDVAKTRAYELLKLYRTAVSAVCRPGEPVLDCMPRLTPERKARVPRPVAAEAAFHPPDQARISHEASADPALERYELRGLPGLEYDERDAVVLASHEPGEERVFFTGFALNQPGAAATFRVFVILSSGAEAGGETLTVARPPG